MQDQLMRKITAIQEVQMAAEAAMNEVISYLRSSDQPSSEVAHAIIDKTLEHYDCESPEGHIVASGIESCEPHEKGRNLIQKGVPVVIDIYPRSKQTGYFADMTRTVCLGEATKELEAMYEAVLQAQNVAIDLLKPGIPCKDIHEAVVSYFSTVGYETSGKGKEFRYAEGFVHGTGHGVSKVLHDAPHINSTSTEILQIGDVVTIEPGLYYKNLGGIRIEDMFLITDTGYEALTHYPKPFIL